MIDIHTHILPNVDDGSESLDKSLSMLRVEEESGVTDVILTPHYRLFYKSEKAELIERYNGLLEEIKKSGIKINVYLGQEIAVDFKTLLKLEKGELLTLNGTEYVLLEFSLTEEMQMAEIIHEFILKGYKPIVAHAERYPHITLEDIYEIKRIGGLIQLNSSSIVGKEKRKFSKICKDALENGLVDFIASDIHGFRTNTLLKCYNFISKKYKDSADKIFSGNAKKIIE